MPDVQHQAVEATEPDARLIDGTADVLFVSDVAFDREGPATFLDDHLDGLVRAVLVPVGDSDVRALSREQQ